MASKEWLDKTLSLCSCTGFPDGKHGPHCHTTVAADLLDEAIREAALKEAEWWDAEVVKNFGLHADKECTMPHCARHGRLAQLREGKT